MSAAKELPVDNVLDAARTALAKTNCLVVEAPPGSGKTTRVVPALAGRPVRGAGGDATLWSADKKVLLIQPRRIAARTAAARIAEENGSSVGEWAGYHVRLDRKIGPQCQVVAMTPGILLRRLQSDPVLEDVSAVVLDEFHERSLDYDLLLGMLRRVSEQLRDDLKLIVMSATLDTQAVMEYFPAAERIVAGGRAYPVDVHHSRFDTSLKRKGLFERIVSSVSDAVIRMAGRYEGDVLAFLPGVGEINAVAGRIGSEARKHDWDVLPLHGSLSPADQQRAVEASSKRKIVLATNIAETSLTIDGVRIVVDSGYARVERFDSATGLNRLELEPISRASADQRAGRAGRTASGVCFRTWDEITGRSRPEHLEPEVHRVDLSAAVLQLLCWGESDLTAFPWVTPPRDIAIESSLSTLSQLGAVRDSELTPVARQLVSMPLQPRLAKLITVGTQLGVGQDAAIAAAVLSERDIVNRDRWRPSGECDIASRIALLKSRGSNDQVDVAAARHVSRIADQLMREVSVAEVAGDAAEAYWETQQARELPTDARLRIALLAAFPDRLAKRRQHGSARGAMVGGKGVQLARQSGVKKSEFFLCLDLDAKGAEAQVRIASAVDPSWLTGANRRSLIERFFNPTMSAVVSRERDYWCDLMLNEHPVETEADEQTARLLASSAAEKFMQLLPRKNKGLHQWIARVEWLRDQLPPETAETLPCFHGEHCARMLENWCFGLRTFEQLKKLPWESLLPSTLSTDACKLLDASAPSKIQLPSGRWVDLAYEKHKPPVLAAKIQELFGWTESPKLAGGKVPLLLHLLAPNGRPQQITDDLASFWKNTYPVVRKDLRGRYPKHKWPEDPLAK
ncbi:MAG: ATP-dependent helicase HrpB [Aureliella sp.]